MTETEDVLEAETKGWMARCILLTPNAQYDAWMDAIRVALENCGLRLVHVQDASHRPIDGVDDRVLLSFRPDLLRPTPDADCTVILTDVATAFSGGHYLTGGRQYDCLVDTSFMLQGAIDFPRDRLITDSIIEKSKDRSVEVLKGVWIDAPEPMANIEYDNALEAAASDAFRIYADGEMQEGLEWFWPPELFELDELKPERRLSTNRMPIMGPPRWLVRGPSLTLPAGRWEVSARFDVDEPAARHRYYFQWGIAEDNLRLTEFKVERPGENAIIVSHVWDAPGRVQMRFIIREGSIDGEFEFLGATVRNLTLDHNRTKR